MNIDWERKKTLLHVSMALLGAGCGLFPDLGKFQGKANARPDSSGEAVRPDAAQDSASDAPGAGGSLGGSVPRSPGCERFANPTILKAPAPATSAGFGAVLTTDGDTLVVVAPMEGASTENVPEEFGPDLICEPRPIPRAPFSWSDLPPDADGYRRSELQKYGAAAGLVYAFDRIGNGFRPACALQASRSDPCDIFGESVSIGKDVLAVGAFGDDGADNGVMDSGAVYLYKLAPNGVSP